MPYLDVNYALPFQSGSGTSRDAALRARQFVGKQGLAVLAWFQARDVVGGTQKECSAALGIARASVCASSARAGAMRAADEVVHRHAARGLCGLQGNEMTTLTLLALCWLGYLYAEAKGWIGWDE